MNEVVITGLGLVSPFGIGTEVALAGLATGQSRLAPRPGPAPLSMATCAMDSQGARASRLLVTAADEAVNQAGTELDGLFVGTCSGEMQQFSEWLEPNIASDANAGQWYQAPALALCKHLAFAQAAFTYTSACTSSLVALHAALHRLRHGAGAVLVAGTDAIAEFTVAGFVALRVAGSEACRPFALGSKWLSFGEGAAAMIIETRAHAERRGATVYGEILGTGLSCDASHTTSPLADGGGLEKAVRRALGSTVPGEVDVVVTHGTGTAANDEMETALLARLGLVQRPWLAHKGYWGHAMGASGLMSLVAGVLQTRAEQDFTVPYETPRSELGGSLKGCRRGLTLSAGFGGGNAAVHWRVSR